MLHDRHLYTVHKVPVRFQRCLACMVAKQGPCGDHKATWLCRSRLTDAPPGVDVQNGKSWLSFIPLSLSASACWSASKITCDSACPAMLVFDHFFQEPATFRSIQVHEEGLQIVCCQLNFGLCRLLANVFSHVIWSGRRLHALRVGHFVLATDWIPS